MEEKRNDEIDLLELSRNMMVRFYHYVIRRYKLLAIFTIIGGILGIGMYLKDRNKYENSIIGIPQYVSSTHLVEIINSLGDINQDKEAISKILSIGKEEANNLIQIEADTMDTRTTIKIDFRFKNDLNLTDFSHKIVQYIDSNAYIKNELRLEKQRKLALIERYKQEINKLDSLQNKILSSDLGNSKDQYGNLLIMNDKVNNFYHQDIINIEEKKQAEIKTLNKMSAFLIIDEKKGTKIKEVSLIGTIIKLMAVFFGVGFVATIALELKRQVKNIEGK